MSVKRLLALTAALIAAVACRGVDGPAGGTAAPLPTPAHVVVIGDFGDGSDGEYAVAGSIRDHALDKGLDAFITTGDNFYSDDVDLVWSGPYGWLSEAGIPVLATWGNHDLDSPTREELVWDTLDPPGRWYSVEIGTGRLLVLDTNRVESEEQISWLRNELTHPAWPLIVTFHHPLYSCGSHGSDPEVQDAWLSLFQEHEVTLALSGHDHDYQRFIDDGTTYVVTGGGGRHLRALQACPVGTPEPEMARDGVHHYVVLDIGNDVIDAEVRAADGTTIDSFRILP